MATDWMITNNNAMDINGIFHYDEIGRALVVNPDLEDSKLRYEQVT